MAVRLIAVAIVAFSSCVAAVAATAAPHVSGIVLVALNPQPEPPGAAESKSVRVALNPQPEPPGKNAFVALQLPLLEAAVKKSTDAGRVALNPQPEPPGITDARRLLPPGPCRELVVKVEVRGAMPITARATEIAAGKCGYDVTVPGARAGDMAKVTISRMWSER